MHLVQRFAGCFHRRGRILETVQLGFNRFQIASGLFFANIDELVFELGNRTLELADLDAEIEIDWLSARGNQGQTL